MPSLLGPTNLPPLQALTLGTPAIVSDVHAFDGPCKNMMIQVPALIAENWANAMLNVVGAVRPAPYQVDGEPTLDALGVVFSTFTKKRARW